MLLALTLRSSAWLLVVGLRQPYLERLSHANVVGPRHRLGFETGPTEREGLAHGLERDMAP